MVVRPRFKIFGVAARGPGGQPLILAFQLMPVRFSINEKCEVALLYTMRPVISNFLAINVWALSRLKFTLPRVGSFLVKLVRLATAGFRFIPGVGPRLTKLSSRKRRKPCKNDRSIGPSLPSAPKRKSFARVLPCD